MSLRLLTLALAAAVMPAAAGAQDYTIAYAHFGPLNSDIFIADREGRARCRSCRTRASITTRRFRPTGAGSCSRRNGAGRPTFTARIQTAAALSS